ncbi:hypothetical protein [Streptomyces sp. NPDC048606]|uniref:hypothetical protein n=1 Tax=Streptomyces sp. NPDC048606 TaxID=3154726 RepID=UPI003415B406
MVSPPDMLGVFAARWDRLAPRLPRSARDELAVLLGRLRAQEGEAGAAAREEVLGRAVRAVLDALPEDEAERLRHDTDPARYAGAQAQAQAQAQVAAGFDAADLCMLVIDGNPMVGPRLGPVRERLLGVPALSEAEVVRAGGDPARRDLIALSDARGRRRYPAFQFESGADPWDIVARINALLGSAEDPWGTADWWVSEHTWWGRPPSALLGTGHDAVLWTAGREAAGAGEED